MIPLPQDTDGQQTPIVRSRLIRQKAENEKKKLEKLDMQRSTKSFSYEMEMASAFQVQCQINQRVEKLS
jgi:hypothetical protein